MLVAGVDGCDRGWLVVQAEVDERLQLDGATVEPTFAEVLRRTINCDAVAVDIPIGLSEDGRREPDIAARQVLRPLRHNSVFPAPVRPVLAARSFKEACAISASVRPDGKKVSKQTYFLSFKIAEADRLLSADPSIQDRLVEIHPEVCFWALNAGQPLNHYKRTFEGEQERLALLNQEYGDDLAAVGIPPGAARDDLYDACAAAWTAARFARGERGTLPPNPHKDSRGLRMEMVY